MGHLAYLTLVAVALVILDPLRGPILGASCRRQVTNGIPIPNMLVSELKAESGFRMV